MERRLLTVIMNPAMVVGLGLRAFGWLSTLASIRWGGSSSSLCSWWAMSGVHGFFLCAAWRDFASDQNRRFT